TVARLTEGGLALMGSQKLVLVLVLVLALGLLGTGAGLLAQRTDGPATPLAREAPPSEPVSSAAPVDERFPPGRRLVDGNASTPVANEGDKPRTDLERLQGIWRVVSVEYDGKQWPPGSELWIFEGEKATVSFGLSAVHWQFTLDETRNPKRI